MLSERVGPESMWLLWIAYTYMARHALGQVVPCEDAESAWNTSTQPTRITRVLHLPAMCDSIHARCLSYEEKSGIPGRQTPCDMACNGVNSFFASSLDRGTTSLDCTMGVGSTWVAEGAMVDMECDRT
jgi:hypothetical protein